MPEDVKAQLWVLTLATLKRNRFRMVVKTPSGTYWRRDKDNAYALLSAKPNGEPQVERLDR
jgi:hypothetical protein